MATGQTFVKLVIALTTVCSFDLFQVVASLPINREESCIRKRLSTAEHFLIVGCDGFGGMYLENATDFLPHFARFYSEGSTTTRMRDRNPSVSAPNWAAITTSMSIEESGVSGNDWVPADDNPSDPTLTQMPPISGAGKVPEALWAAAKVQNPQLKTAVAISWDWINYLCVNKTVDYLFRGHGDDAAVAHAMAGFIKDHQPNIMFVHFDSIDDAGHSSYWGSPKYYNATKNVDSYLGILLDALESAGIADNTVTMVTADHGGWRSGHGMFSESNMYIPGLFMGPNVKKGYKIEQSTSNLDFAPTGFAAIGLEPGEFMRGRVLKEIFSE